MDCFSAARPLIAVALWLGLAPCLAAQREEEYRSQYHFSPNNGWIGDPDGLVHYRGVYHLFWWGHAISRDLVHWTELPYPIQGDPGPYRTDTGASAIDKKNVSGLGADSFINFHTLTGEHDQRVGASFSTDSTHHFTDFTLLKANPILSPHPAPAEDFRDPDVFWDEKSKSWIMVVTLGDRHQLQFYRSTDLLHWGDGAISTFGPDGDVSAAWETPNLFPLPVDGDAGQRKWVLTVAVSPNRLRYFIGSFDGTNFTNLYPGKSFVLDAGPDFYAARTWREFDGPTTSTPLLGWMGNWRYSRHAPSQASYGGEGVMSLPRDLALRTYPEGIRLVQTPLPGLKQLRQNEVQSTNIAIFGAHPITDFVRFLPRRNSYEIDATFRVNGAASFGFHLLADRGRHHQLTVQYDPSHSTLSVDRSTSSDATLNAYFTAPIAPVPVEAAGGQLRLHMFIDESSIEIFTNDGKVVMSALTYPGVDQLGIEVFSTGGSTPLTKFSAWELASIWEGSPTAKIESGSTYDVQSRASEDRLDPSVMGGLEKPYQRWKIDLVEQGVWQSFDRWMPASYRITDRENGRVLERCSEPGAKRSIVEESVWDGNDHQKWQITGVGGGYYKVVSLDGGREALQIRRNGSMDEGRAGFRDLEVGKFFAYREQEWRFLPVP